MRVVVTGVAGFIGSAVARALLASGDEVVGVDCLLPDLYPADVKQRQVDALVGRQGFSFAPLDLRTDEVRPLLEDADVVVNMAALPGLAKSWECFAAYQGCNTLVVQRLLAGLADHPDVHLVQASTSSVYGRLAQGDEAGPLAPISPYAVTKLAAEHLVSAYRAGFGVRATVLRYFSVYGPGQRPDMAYSILCERLLEGRAVQVTGDGRQTRSNTYVDDVVAATVEACRIRPDGAVLNVCGSERISLLDALGVLADELGEQPHVEFLPGRAGDQAHTGGDAARAREVLGWRPVVGIEDGLRRQARRARAGALGA